MNDEFDVPGDWHESFFTGPVNAFWEGMMPPEATAADAAFAARHLAAPTGGRILDIPCGAGRHALALAAEGYQVTGVDISEDAIHRATAAARERRLPATFLRSDMRRFEVDRPFDGILCLGNSVSYFDTADVDLFFGNLAQNLVRGGRLILDSGCCAESIFPVQGERRLAFERGSYEARMRYDPRTSRLCTAAELHLDGEVHRLRYAHYVLTAGALVRLLEAAGLRTLGLYADTDDRPFLAGSPRLLLAAARTG
jgi:cyclopropane fatty-acyl-phospholipid synthase-like methyltransferase